MKRVLVLLSVLLLSGCASYGSYRHVDRPSAGDYYYDVGHPGYAHYGYPYDVAYRYYPYYYSLFWGFRPYYYDPFYSPGFHYGVTWFPRTWFSFSLGGYHDWGWYHAYSPWRYSFWDNYYTWYQAPRRIHRGRIGHGHAGHFGSARNEAERLSSLGWQTRRGLRTASPAIASRDAMKLGARSRGGAIDHRSQGVPGPRAVRPATAGRAMPAERSSRAIPRSGTAVRRAPQTNRGARPSPRVDDPQARSQRGSWRAEPRYGSPAASAPRAAFRRSVQGRPDVTVSGTRAPAQRAHEVQSVGLQQRAHGERGLRPAPRIQAFENVPRAPAAAPQRGFNAPAPAARHSAAPTVAPRPAMTPPARGAVTAPAAPQPQPARAATQPRVESGRVRGQR